MSRNFESSTQIESEAGATDDRAEAEAGRAVIKALAPSDQDVAVGDEMMRLVQSVFLSSNASAPRRVVFCGVDSENGSSYVCANAGKTLAAKSALPVCLLDGNLRSPRLSGLFEVDTTLASLKRSGSLRGRCIQIGANLWLAGHELLTDDRGAIAPVARLKQLLADLEGVFEFVLIDAPGVGACGDAAILGQVADATVLVIDADNTRRLAARKAKETLNAADVRLLGTVLCNRSFPIPKRLYHRL